MANVGNSCSDSINPFVICDCRESVVVLSAFVFIAKPVVKPIVTSTLSVSVIVYVSDLRLVVFMCVCIMNSVVAVGLSVIHI